MTDLTPQTVAALAERYKKAVSDAAFYAGTPSGQDRELNVLRDQLIAAQAAEIERLRGLFADLDALITNHVKPSDGPHTFWIDGQAYHGPAVDGFFAILKLLQDGCRKAALEGAKT